MLALICVPLGESLRTYESPFLEGVGVRLLKLQQMLRHNITSVDHPVLFSKPARWKDARLTDHALPTLQASGESRLQGISRL